MKPLVIWVLSCKHLGDIIVSKASANAGEIGPKEQIFINKNNKLFQEFHLVSPGTIIEVKFIINSQFHSSVLWNLSSKWMEKLDKSWNVATRRMFDLPKETHCYLVELVSKGKHVQIIMARRFLNFVKIIRNSKKIALRCRLNQ